MNQSPDFSNQSPYFALMYIENQLISFYNGAPRVNYITIAWKIFALNNGRIPTREELPSLIAQAKFY